MPIGVGDDQNEGVGMLADYLYQLGHRRIGFLSMSGGKSWLFDRFAGYQWAIKRLNLADAWALEMSWGKDRNPPIQQVDKNIILYKHNGFIYELRCLHGQFRKTSNTNSLLICPETGQIVLSRTSQEQLHN